MVQAMTNGGAIVAIVICMASLIAVAVYYVYRNKRKPANETKSTTVIDDQTTQIFHTTASAQESVAMAAYPSGQGYLSSQSNLV